VPLLTPISCAMSSAVVSPSSIHWRKTSIFDASRRPNLDFALVARGELPFDGSLLALAIAILDEA
jgi:cytochrome c556